MEACGADSGGWQTFRQVDGVAVVSRWLVEAEGRVATIDDRLRLASEEEWTWPIRDPMRPRPEWVRRLSTLALNGGQAAYEAVMQSPYVQAVLAPCGIIDQCRILAYSGDRFVGWLGALRITGEPRFSAKDVRRANPLVPALSSALVAADQAERASRPEEACDLLVSPDGEVLYRSRAAIPWLERPDSGARVRRWARAVSDGDARAWREAGLHLRWVRADGPKGDAYFVSLRPERPLMRSPTWRLTDAELEVADLLCDGATIPETAEILDVSRETARSHRNQVYAKLGVHNRAELVALLHAAA